MGAAMVLVVLVLVFPQVVSADSFLSRIRPFVETGAQGGGAIGVEGPTFSHFKAVSEIGVMFDKYRDGVAPKSAFGFAFYAGMGKEDFRIGFKPRVRYRFNRDWAVDVSAGALFASLEGDPYVSDIGFVGGVSLNYSSWLTLKTDVNVVKVEDRPMLEGGKQVGIVDGGQEISLYGGVSLRNKAGWIATFAGTLTFIGVSIVLIAGGSTS